MRVGWDCDGVLFNFGDSVKRYLDSINMGHIWKSGDDLKPFWNFYESWGWSSEEFVELCNNGVDAGIIFSGPPREHAVESVERVHQLGHTNVVITDRAFGSTPEVSQRITYEWFDRWGIPYDEIHFSADKTIVPTDLFVEDKLENYDALIAAGTDCYLINRPWNEADDNRKRIDSILDYVEIVERKTREQWGMLV